MKIGGGLTVERMVELGRVSRSGFYRFDDADPGPDPDMDLRDAIQKIAVEWPAYGREGRIGRRHPRRSRRHDFVRCRIKQQERRRSMLHSSDFMALGGRAPQS